MLKRISIFVLAFSLALGGCATSPKIATQEKSFDGRFLASQECPSKPCVYIQSYNGSQATFVGEGFSSDKQKSYQVNIYADGKFLEDINTNPNGSFSYTTKAGQATYGTRMEVKVLNWDGSGIHWTGNATIARQEQPKNQNQNRNSDNNQQQQPAPPPAYRMPDDKLQNYAEQQARTVANRVARTYGELEKWKYNFTMGYWQGAQIYANTYEARVDYDNGAVYGRDHGAKPGYNAGAARGASQGNEVGQEMAVGRFRSIVNTGQGPDLQIGQISTPGFGGLSAPSGVCDTVSSKSTELERQLSNEMKIIRFGDDDYGYLPYDATIYSITFKEINGYGSGKFEFVDSWFRTDYAWNEWFQNDLGGKYDKVNYRKLESDQAAQFQRYFRSAYDQSIDEKFYKKKTEFNAAANARGQYYGVQIAKRQQIDKGCAAGYNESYTPASIHGFGDAYVNSVRSGFTSTADYYQRNPVVTIDGIKLVDGNQNGAYELGESLGIEIGSYTNLGRVPARDLAVRMAGSGITETPSTERITLDASTSKAVNQKVMNLAKIREDVIADQSQAISVSVGSKSQVLAFTVSWSGAIQALTTVDPGKAASLKNFVMKNIQDEYTATEQAKNDIYKEGATSKMLELVQLFERTPENQRGVIRSMGAPILAWHAGYKHAHNKWSTGKLRKNFAALAARIH